MRFFITQVVEHTASCAHSRLNHASSSFVHKQYQMPAYWWVAHQAPPYPQAAVAVVDITARLRATNAYECTNHPEPKQTRDRECGWNDKYRGVTRHDRLAPLIHEGHASPDSTTVPAYGPASR